MITRLHKYWIWLILSLPAGVMLWRYATDAITYGQVVHESGQWSAAALVLALAVTPLRALLGNVGLVRWLLRQRRALGVASFAYAALHTLVYLERKAELARIVKEAQNPDLIAGWLALIIFVPLAITSNNLSVRRLGKNWKRLHRSAYLATALLFVHWLLATVNTLAAWLTLALIIILETLRIARRKKV
ncbi:MAG: sulfite oxidase heme-binding subunit YedZ [Gammaproteobacteria bacterium]